MQSGLLHPTRIVTGAANFWAVGRIKRWVVRRLYDHLARAYPLPNWTTMNYGFAPLPGDAAFEAVSAGETERCGLNLYWRVATAGCRGADLGPVDVLEIGSGRGGGAAFLATALAPARVIGLDVAAEAVALARTRYAAIPNLTFVQGDAEALSIADETVDLVVNVESAHCYASVPRFLREVARVLKPGGELMFAGFAARRGGAYDRLVAALRSAPFSLDRLDDITANVVASLEIDEARKRALIDAAVTGPLRSFAIGAYAMAGTEMRRALEERRTVYVAAALTKR